MKIVSFMTIKLLNKSFILNNQQWFLFYSLQIRSHCEVIWPFFFSKPRIHIFLGRVTDRHICWYRPAGWCSLGHNGSGRSRPCSRRSRGCRIWCHWRTHQYLREQRERRPSEFTSLRQQTADEHHHQEDLCQGEQNLGKHSIFALYSTSPKAALGVLLEHGVTLRSLGSWQHAKMEELTVQPSSLHSLRHFTGG